MSTNVHYVPIRQMYCLPNVPRIYMVCIPRTYKATKSSQLPNHKNLTLQINHPYSNHPYSIHFAYLFKANANFYISSNNNQKLIHINYTTAILLYMMYIPLIFLQVITLEMRHHKDLPLISPALSPTII